MIFCNQLAFADELRLDLSKSEEKNILAFNEQSSVEDTFNNFLQKFRLKVKIDYDAEQRVLLCSGEKSVLKVAEYLYISNFRDTAELNLKFSYFEGSSKKRTLKNSFTKKLKTNNRNTFQYSNRLLEGAGQDINGFTFSLEPGYDVFQKSLLLVISMSYKNEEKVIGDKGAQVFDLKTSIRMDPGKEMIFKVSDKNDPGWNVDSYLSFELKANDQSKYFEKSLPRSLRVTKDFYLRQQLISSGAMQFFKNDPVRYLRQLGVPFPSGSNAILNKKTQMLYILNTIENFELFDTVGGMRNTDFHDNIEWAVSIFESNLIITDPDKLNGHTLKKVTSFDCICSKNSTFTFSKTFNGDYESVVYMDAMMPVLDDCFNYNVILKREGPKLKAKNYKLESTFGNNKKYRIPLDKYHFIEISVEK